MDNLDYLEKLVKSYGFKIAHHNSLDGNLCTWYAYRPTELPARRCECNEDKPLQIVIEPWKYNSRVSVSVSLTGKVNEIWVDLRVYSLSVNELERRFTAIECMLVESWNVMTGWSADSYLSNVNRSLDFDDWKEFDDWKKNNG